MNLSSSDVGVWICVAVLLIPAIKVIADWCRPTPAQRLEQPIEVKSAVQYMSAEACRTMHMQVERFEAAKFDAIEKRLTELTAAMDRRNADGEERASAIHARINPLAQEIRGVSDTLNNHLADHRARKV
jgi:hypothetical protein